ncbi:MAG TPA: hypothetical protein VFD92_16355 [Candidatus Binatia bacterium]|nr:hypothetical protein [Candidatus Binatia bacterium]
MAEVADAYVTFSNVKIIRSTATALFCSIDDKCVWLPRGQTRGKPRSKGDRGTLLVRYAVALDRQLVKAPDVEIPVASPDPTGGPAREGDRVPVALEQERSPRAFQG